MDIETQIAGNHNRRMAAQIRFLSRREKLEAECEALIGELTRDGATVYYLNILNRAGEFTGKVKESRRWVELADYAIRNRYVG